MTEVGRAGETDRPGSRRNVRIRRPDPDFAIDEAAEILVRGDHAQRRPILDQRHVDHPVEAIVAAAVLCSRAFDFDGRFILGEVGLVGDEPYGAAHGTRAIERALGAAQYLDPRQIKEIGIDARGRAVAAGRQDGRLIDIQSRGRRIAADGGDAADGIAAAARPRGIQCHRRDARRQGGEVLGSELGQGL